jgi:hypothetical protein
MPHSDLEVLVPASASKVDLISTSTTNTALPKYGQNVGCGMNLTFLSYLLPESAQSRRGPSDVSEQYIYKKRFKRKLVLLYQAAGEMIRKNN